MPSLDSIRALVAKPNFYDSGREDLEAYVDAESKGDVPYFMEANKLLLKTYQFFPNTADEERTALILMLSLAEFPSTDLAAMTFLVPDRMQRSEPCRSILSCASHLTSCDFKQFWESFQNLLDSHFQYLIPANNPNNNIVERLQKSIVNALALAYRSAPLALALDAANLGSADALKSLKASCVESVSSDKVLFVATEDNTKRSRVFQEGVDFGTISSLMSKVVGNGAFHRSL